MKKHFLMLAAAFVFAACGDVIEVPDVEPSGKGDTQPEEEYKFSGDVVFTGTKADLVDGTSQRWISGEEIVLSDGSKVQTSKNTQDGQIAQFAANVTDGSTQFVAFYPNSEGVSISGTTVTAVLPVAQNVGEVTAPMVAKSTSSVLFFNNITSRLAFTVDMEGVKDVKLKTSSPVAGDLTVDFSGNDPIVTSAASEVTLSGDFQKGETYYFTLSAGTLESVSLELSNGSSVIANASAENVNLKAGETTSIGTIIEDVPTYKVSHIWVYGGTGPEYGGGKLYDLLEKGSFFNSEDGRGIAAIKDNYFELQHNGQFYNWAGEDARNWWMVYSGAHNPTNGKDVDLHELYDLIPRHDATYVLDSDGKITFTWSNGRVTSGQIVPAGTYKMPVSNLDVKIETMAIKFSFSGGHDDWNNMYNEWNAIACRPRAMFVELVPMETTFHTPEASKTIDADFEYVAPLEPDQKFDFSTFPGSWNVRGGNSSPYGIWVLGGTGDDPAFISPIDKSWDWNDSIWKESDNGLVIKVSERTATQIKGTTNYWCGNDGAFWDYKWNSTGQDLSDRYGQLPHGEYEFTLDLETFVITFGNGKKAKFLEPGEHTFVHGKTLSIPDGMFGFDFEIGDDSMDTPTSKRWTDIDRFIYGSRDYVMIFEKQ